MLERRPAFLDENRRLLPRGEVPAPFGLVGVNELGTGPLGPAPRGLILLAGKTVVVAYCGKALSFALVSACAEAEDLRARLAVARERRTG